jgi:flagellar biosynthetic protein FliR
MTPAAVVYVGLLLARLGAFVAVMPPFSGQTPRLVRVGLVVALAGFYLGQVSPEWDPSLAGKAASVDPFRYGVALAREALIGAAMGFAFGLFVLPARIAGEFLTSQIGLNVAPLPGPTGEEAAGPLTGIFETVAALVFLVADGHHIVLAALHASFVALPLGGTAIPDARPMVNGLAVAYEMGMLLAGPLAACLFLLAVTLAVMARTAPQLNIYSVGFSLQVLVVMVGGLFLLPEFVLTLHAVIAITGESLPTLLGGR